MRDDDKRLVKEAALAVTRADDTESDFTLLLWLLDGDAPLDDADVLEVRR